MSDYALTALAKTDIFQIWSYIAEHNENAANRVEQAIYDACSFLADSPLRGHLRPDLTPRPVRFWTVRRYRNYMIVYRHDTIPLQIIAVLHRKRDIQRILRRR
jgi:plasmid stabilization system protein ParE